jgi:membrane protease subunit (stomatin/prohibitin family)
MKADNALNGDVVRVYAGPTVAAGLCQQALKETGIESKVVGLALGASFGSAMPDSVEVWVRAEDADAARAAVERFEARTDTPA